MPSPVEQATQFPAIVDGVFEIRLNSMLDLPLSLQHHQSAFREYALPSLPSDMSTHHISLVCHEGTASTTRVAEDAFTAASGAYQKATKLTQRVIELYESLFDQNDHDRQSFKKAVKHFTTFAILALPKTKSKFKKQDVVGSLLEYKKPHGKNKSSVTCVGAITYLMVEKYAMIVWLGVSGVPMKHDATKTKWHGIGLGTFLIDCAVAFHQEKNPDSELILYAQMKPEVLVPIPEVPVQRFYERFGFTCEYKVTRGSNADWDKLNRYELLPTQLKTLLDQEAYHYVFIRNQDDHTADYKMELWKCCVDKGQAARSSAIVEAPEAEGDPDPNLIYLKFPFQGNSVKVKEAYKLSSTQPGFVRNVIQQSSASIEYQNLSDEIGWDGVDQRPLSIFTAANLVASRRMMWKENSYFSDSEIDLFLSFFFTRGDYLKFCTVVPSKVSRAAQHFARCYAVAISEQDESSRQRLQVEYENHSRILKSFVMAHSDIFQKPFICYIVNEEDTHWTLVVSVNASLALEPNASAMNVTTDEPICGFLNFDSLIRNRAHRLGIPAHTAFRTFLNFAMINLKVVENALPEFNMSHDHFGEDRDVHGLSIKRFRQLVFHEQNECYLMQSDSWNCGPAVIANIIAVVATWDPRSLHMAYHNDAPDFKALTIGDQSFCKVSSTNNHVLILGECYNLKSAFIKDFDIAFAIDDDNAADEYFKTKFLQDVREEIFIILDRLAIARFDNKKPLKNAYRLVWKHCIINGNQYGIELEFGIEPQRGVFPKKKPIARPLPKRSRVNPASVLLDSDDEMQIAIEASKAVAIAQDDNDLQDTDEEMELLKNISSTLSDEDKKPSAKQDSDDDKKPSAKPDESQMSQPDPSIVTQQVGNANFRRQLPPRLAKVSNKVPASPASAKKRKKTPSSTTPNKKKQDNDDTKCASKKWCRYHQDINDADNVLTGVCSQCKQAAHPACLHTNTTDELCCDFCLQVTEVLPVGMFEDDAQAEAWLFQESEKAAEASNNNDDANANVTLDQFIDNSFKKWGWLSQKEFQQFRERTKKEISWLHRAVLRQSSKTDILELTNKDKQSLHYKSLEQKKRLLKSEVKLFEKSKKQFISEYHKTTSAICVGLLYQNGQYKAKLEYKDANDCTKYVTEEVAFSWVKANLGLEWIAYLHFMVGKEKKAYVPIPPWLQHYETEQTIVAMQLQDGDFHEAELENGDIERIDAKDIPKEVVAQLKLRNVDEDGFVGVPAGLLNPLRVSSKQIIAVRYVPDSAVDYELSDGTITTVRIQSRWFCRYANANNINASGTEVDEEELEKRLGASFCEHVKQKDASGFIRVPVGKTRKPVFHVYPHLTKSYDSPQMKFRQGNQDTCIFSSFASALYYVGFWDLATDLDKNKEEDMGGRHGLKSLLKIMQKEVRWLTPKWFRNVTTPCFMSQLPHYCIAVAVLQGSDGSANHAVSIVTNSVDNCWLFDSNEEYAVPCTQRTLDICTRMSDDDEETTCDRIHEAIIFVDQRDPSRLQSMLENRMNCIPWI